MPRIVATLAGLTVAVSTVSAGCSPTVELGSNAEQTSSGSAATDSGGTEGSGFGTSASSPPDSSTGPGAAPDSTTAATATTAATESAGGTDTTAVTTTDEGTSTGPAQSCRDAFGGGIPCLQCAELQCCEEIDLCLGQPECDCFLQCLDAGNPPFVCPAMCEPTSGAAAVTTCLMMACTFDCSMP